MADRNDWKMAFMASELTPTTRLVLHTIGEHLDNNGRDARVSVGEIVRQSGLSRRAVLTHLRIAHDAGWLLIDMDALHTGKGVGRKYDAEIPHIGAPAAPKNATHIGAPAAHLAKNLLYIRARGRAQIKIKRARAAAAR